MHGSELLCSQVAVPEPGSADSEVFQLSPVGSEGVVAILPAAPEIHSEMDSLPLHSGELSLD